MTAIAKRIVTVDIVSDVICPWCYIGKARFDKAVDAFKAKHGSDSLEFVVKYKPFELSNSLDKKGTPKLQMYTEKFGPAMVQRMLPHMIATGKAEGIHFNYDGIVASTFDAHRLIHFAEQKGIQVQVSRELFAAYHEQAKNIGDDEVLADCFAKAGGDRAAAIAFLKSDEAADLVRQRQLDVRRRGITGVPHFIIDGKHEIGGAQEPEAFVQLFEKLAASN